MIMRLLLLCGLLIGMAAPSHALIIRNDNGGHVYSYAIRYAHAQKPIRIMGSCKSACTLALHYRSTCVGSDASLWFHAVRGAGKHNRRLTQWVYGLYPPAVRTWIRSHGGLTSRPIILRGAELRRIVKSCGRIA